MAVKRAVKSVVARLAVGRSPSKAPTRGNAGVMAYIVQALVAHAVPMSSVRLDPQNPRRNDDAARKLAELIRAHGFRVPIVVDETGMIIAGNTRYKAMRLLGATHIPAIRQTFLSPEAARAFGIGDNKSSEWSQWDEAVLARLLQTPAMKAFLPQTGFSERELDIVHFKTTTELLLGANIESIIESAVQSVVPALHYGVVRHGKICFSNAETFVEIPTDGTFAENTVLDLKRFLRTRDMTLACVSKTEHGVPKADDIPRTPDIGRKLYDIPASMFLPGCPITGEMPAYASKSPTRPALRGICVDKGVIFATDGHVAVAVAAKGVPKTLPSFILPVTTWGILAGRNVSTTLYERRAEQGAMLLVATLDGVRIVSTIGGEPPKLLRHLSNGKSVHATPIDAERVLRTIEVLQPLTDAKHNGLTVRENLLTTFGSTLTTHFKATMPETGSHPCIAFDSRELARILRHAMTLGDVRILFDTETTPIRVFAGEVTFIVMPLKCETPPDAAKCIIVHSGRVSTEARKRVRVTLRTAVGVIGVDAFLGYGITREILTKRLASKTIVAEVAVE